MEFEKLLEEWKSLTRTQREECFFSLERRFAEELFLKVSPLDQAELLVSIPVNDRKYWVRSLAPDDAADLIQSLPEDEKVLVLELLDAPTRSEVGALLAYKEDVAGGLMNSRFARIRPDMSVDEAISYLRAQTRSQVEMIYYAYVLDQAQRLLGVVSLRQLFTSGPQARVEDIMLKKEKVTIVRENEDQEKIARIFTNKDLLAVPVLDKKDRMKGIVTIDDVVGIVEKEATEDIQKFGGVEALDAPYFQIGFLKMIRKRVAWLMVLFIGQMFTATAMGLYEDQIAKAVVLVLFIPLIISSGGNSGSQASTLVIRAMAIGEVRLRDWKRVLFRELGSGLTLGLILGFVGLLRILIWPDNESLFGKELMLVGLTVSMSLLGIVIWGTTAGSMLPFILRKFELDPATASAPFVATLVDVTGIIIYFSIANLFLLGTLL